MMAELTRIVEKIAALLMAWGVPAAESTLYALILIYLLVTGFLSVGLLTLLLRRRSRVLRNGSSSDQES